MADRHVSGGRRPDEAELLTARNRARHAVAALPDEPRIMRGLLLTRRDLEVLLAFTDAQAAELEHRIAIMSSRPSELISKLLSHFRVDVHEKRSGARSPVRFSKGAAEVFEVGKPEGLGDSSTECADVTDADQ